ncbi:MAG: hypothetical protein AVDCRST_MAG40-101 [uncultured Gemmatimonadaceae bacterium]|uniref:Uncharacterized protein n=1 Tax=uncultured Gemmatimonadaceae bacterium TaxID=246130 RepID=A0A6J4K6E9_9BACT|nr:MAG: hypothetical protein AVDCRST_MAG40-101 [uncultured Gemmatimonadaceae bacterium]
MIPFRTTSRYLTGAALTLLLGACADSAAITAPPPLSPAPLATVATGDVCSTIDFNSFTHGGGVTTVTAAGATFTVAALPYAGPNGVASTRVVARAFDTDATSPLEDRDLLWKPEIGGLCTACNGLGRVLIIEDPDGFASSGDSRFGGVMRFTATAGSGTFYIKQFTSVDQDAQGSAAAPYFEGLALSLFLDNSTTAAVTAPRLGNGTVATVAVPGTPTFTTRFDFRIGNPEVGYDLGSGAVDNIQVCRVTTPPPPPPPPTTPTNPGTGTPGYWKNHPAAWPVASIVIGGRTYTKAMAISLMQAATKGDKTYNMFEQLVSAKLNVAIGNDASCISAGIAAADSWMARYPVGSNVSSSSAAWTSISATFTRLDQYNNGRLCAPHRG